MSGGIVLGTLEILYPTANRNVRQACRMTHVILAEVCSAKRTCVYLSIICIKATKLIRKHICT